MIPKKIHYCWFGNNSKSSLVEKCIRSWKKYCQDYEIIEWNEENFDISQCPLYVQEAYQEKQWAFVTDYVRLKIVYENGGIYMDTDVELKKNLDEFLKYNGYFGFEDGVHIATGLGFGSVAKTPILLAMMKDYEGISFIKEDGSYNLMPCPERNTSVFLKHGLRQDNSKQVLGGNILVLPSIYLCPISYSTGKKEKSLKTVSIHWFSASWKDSEKEKQRWKNLKQQRKMERKDYIRHIPNRIIRKILGNEIYDKIKERVK